MNSQQARIVEAYLEMAADQRLQDGVVDIIVLTNLAEAGFDLRGLDQELETIVAHRG